MPPSTRLRWPSSGWPEQGGNPCAEHVLDQVGALFSSRVTQDQAAWAFHWGELLPSAGIRPKDALSHVGITTGHIQGFTRTYSERLPFFATHSNRGSVLAIGPDKPYGARLLSLEPTHGVHPSGAHVIGRYVAVIDQQELVLYDTQAPGREVARHRLPLHVHGGGGGFGLARLSGHQVTGSPTASQSPRSDDTHLMIVAFPGSYIRGPRYIAFLRLHGSLLAPTRIEHLGTPQVRLPEKWQDYVYSENLSLVSECGTNKLFALQTTGSDRLYGTGYVRVSEVAMGAAGPEFTAVAVGSRPQRQDVCHFRSSATFFVTREHHIELYCHERTVQRGFALRDASAFRFAVLRAH